VLAKDYSQQDYIKQFTFRVGENLAKLDRVEQFHRTNVTDAPDELFRILAEQKNRLLDAQRRFGNYISPFDL
jgi:phosphoenolpyruvate carboxykinase (GTP)